MNNSLVGKLSGKKFYNGKHSFLVPEDMAFSIRGDSYYEKNFDFWFETLVQYLNKPIVYDVGANFGYYSVKLSDSAERIYSFEPVPNTYQYLLENLKTNKLSNVTPVQKGLGNNVCTSEINIYSSSGNNSLFKRSLPSDHDIKFLRKEKIEIDKIDNFIKKTGAKEPDIIKIDTEGGELKILNGAEDILQRHMPVLLLEFSEEIYNDAGYSRTDMADYLRKLGYQLLGIPEVSIDYRLFSDPLDERVANIIAIPKKNQKLISYLKNTALKKLTHLEAPKISIIVPVYNVFPYLEQCLNSIISQSFDDIEIICVNDGSTDKSLSLLEKFADRDSRIKIINKKNGGLSSARNAGLEVARGDYVGFVDSDDWISADMFKKLYEQAIKTDSDIVMVSLLIYDEGKKEFVGVDPYYTLEVFPKYFDGKVFKPRSCRNFIFRICATAVDKLYKRSLLEKIDARFPEGLHFEDNPFFYKTFLSAKNISIIREPLYYYRQERGDAITSRPTRKYFDMLAIQNEIIKVFKETGNYKDYRISLIQNKIFSIRYRFNMLDEPLKKEFFKQIKKDFNSMALSKWILARIPEDLRSYYLAIIKLNTYKEDDFRNATVMVRRDFNSDMGSFIMQFYGMYLAGRALVRRVARRIIGLRTAGINGIGELMVDTLKALKRIIYRIFSYINKKIFPLRESIADNISENSRRLIKRLLRLEFLTIKIKESNSRWSGPLVTVITTFYNQSDTIIETVDSVLKQNFNNFEYIIVNDGSTDAERKVLDKIKDSRVKIIDFKENIGKGSPAAARNVGLKEARGKYIMCLDGDDMIDPTYVEKFVTVFETSPDVGIVTSDVKMFGASNEVWKIGKFRIQRHYRETLLHCASMFRSSFLKMVDGYKEGIGYEDWEFWINLIEAGAKPVNIRDKVFLYRVLPGSRYKQDFSKHKENYKKIVSLHRFYRLKAASWELKRFFIKKVVIPETSYINLDKGSFTNDVSKPRVLIAIPWMTYGGAETLVKNVTSSLSEDFEFSFITGHYSDNMMEESYRKISNKIYHLPYLFQNSDEYALFINNYIKTKNVLVLHIFHNAYLFNVIPKIRAANPNLKIVVTMFNSNVKYFNKAVQLENWVDLYTSDNQYTLDCMEPNVEKSKLRFIRNGLDVKNTFNPVKYDGISARKELGISPEDTVVLFVGRMSSEKNPKFILKMAEITSDDKSIKYIFVGDGPLFYKIQEKHKYDENVIMLGFREDTANLLSASDIFLLPSKIEGSPQTIAEAMSMGRVVFANAVGGVPELINNKENGYLIDVNNPQEVVNLVYKIKHSKELQKVGMRARKYATENLPLSEMANGYKNLYTSIIGKK